MSRHAQAGLCTAAREGRAPPPLTTTVHHHRSAPPRARDAPTLKCLMPLGMRKLML